MVEDDDFSDFECIDCGVNTMFNDEYYMLLDDIWENDLGLHSHEGMMCIGCVESRLGRRLTSEDFADVPLNSLTSPYSAHWTKSDRLVDRLTS